MHAAIKGLLGFVKRHAETYSAAGRTVCRDCRARVEDCDELGTCEGSLARYALEAWAARKPLHEDRELLNITGDAIAQSDGDEETVLRWLDTELLGAREPVANGGR